MNAFGQKGRASVAAAVALVVVGTGLAVAGQVLWAVDQRKKCDSAPPTAGEGGSAALAHPSHGEARRRGRPAPGTASRVSPARPVRAPGAAARPPRAGRPTRVGRRPSMRVTPLPPEVLSLAMAKRSGKLTRADKEKIRSLAQGRADGRWEFTVTGFAVERSSPGKNRKLAKRRANAAAAELRAAGVPRDAVIVRHKVPGAQRDRSESWRKVTVAARFRGKRR